MGASCGRGWPASCPPRTRLTRPYAPTSSNWGWPSTAGSTGPNLPRRLDASARYPCALAALVRILGYKISVVGEGDAASPVVEVGIESPEQALQPARLHQRRHVTQHARAVRVSHCDRAGVRVL